MIATTVVEERSGTPDCDVEGVTHERMGSEIETSTGP